MLVHEAEKEGLFNWFLPLSQLLLLIVLSLQDKAVRRNRVRHEKWWHFLFGCYKVPRGHSPCLGFSSWMLVSWKITHLKVAWSMHLYSSWLHTLNFSDHRYLLVLLNFSTGFFCLSSLPSYRETGWFFSLYFTYMALTKHVRKTKASLACIDKL